MQMIQHSTSNLLALWHADDHGAGMHNPSADHRPSQSQVGTQRLPGTAPILNRRRAAPTAPPHPHSSPALGVIPFRTASTSGANPMLESSTLHSQADSQGTLHASWTDGIVEEEGELGGRHSSVEAAATQSTR